MLILQSYSKKLKLKIEHVFVFLVACQTSGGL